MNLETNSRIVQAFVDGEYPVGDKEFWETHMTDKHFIMDLLKVVSENYYSHDPVVCTLLDKIEAHVYKASRNM
jgi:hypothetical protein